MFKKFAEWQKEIKAENLIDIGTLNMYARKL